MYISMIIFRCLRLPWTNIVMGLISFIKRMNSKESDEGQTASAVDSEKENGHAIGKIESKTERKNRMNTDIKAVNSLIEELKEKMEKKRLL